MTENDHQQGPHARPTPVSQPQRSPRLSASSLPYPHVTVPGTEVMAEWECLKAEESVWPVVVGTDEELGLLAEQYGRSKIEDASSMRLPPQRSPEEILNAAAKIRFPADPRWVPKDQLQEIMGTWPSTAETEHDPSLRVPSGPRLPSMAYDALGRKISDRVHILLVPAQAGWEVPAYLRWGGWNACPSPEENVAALRSWHERYGVELVGIGHDKLDARATNVPADRDEAMRLAEELYLYCPDLVEQGMDTIARLASYVMRDNWWSFWWD